MKDKRAEKHQRCLDILDCIKAFERRRGIVYENIKMYEDLQFTEHADEEKEKAQLIDRCIARLEMRYAVAAGMSEQP